MRDRARARTARGAEAPALAVMGLLAVSLATLACGAGGPAVAPRPSPRAVILVSFDGFRHDYATRAPTPGFDRIAALGAHADALAPPFPTQTFASHAALATGASADRHGIVNNVFRDRARGEFRYGADVGWYDVPPLWIHATWGGARAAVSHWVSCAGAWHGIAPWRTVPFDKSVSDDARIAEASVWLAAPPTERPRLIMLYLSGCDRAGHDHGPDSPEIVACVARVDAQVRRLMGVVDAASGPTTLVLVSDHGMTQTLGALNPEAALRAAGVDAQVRAAGPVAHVYTDDAATLARARLALEALDHARVYTPETLPPEWRYRRADRTGDLVVVADAGWVHDTDLPGLTSPPTGAGHHGHPAEHPDMPGILYLWGDGVRPGGRVARARTVDVFPTVAALLDLPPAPWVEGEVLRALVAP